jgi:hypothetical protein
MNTPTLISTTEVEQHMVPSIEANTMNQAIRRRLSAAPAAAAATAPSMVAT